MAPNTEVLDALKEHSKKYEDIAKGINARIDALEEKQTDTANEEITELKTQLGNLQDAHKALEEAQKDAQTFGMPGLGEELKSKPFSWTSYLLAQYLEKAKGVPYEKAWEKADAEYEREICKQYSEQRRAVMEKSVILKDQSSDDGTLGGFLVPPEASNEIIDLTMDQMPLLNMPGVMKLRGMHGDLFVPKITGRHTGYHVGENEKPTKSDATFGGVTLKPKKVGAFTKQSNRLIYQTRGVSDTVIKRLLSESASLEWHRGLLEGTGSDSMGKGIMSFAADMTTTYDGTNTLQAYDSTTEKYRLRIDTAAKMQQALDNVNELRDSNTYGYLMHPQVKWGMKRERVLQYSGQSESQAMPIYGMNILMNDDRLRDALGYDFRTTNQISKDSNKRTNVVFGDWSLFWTAQFRDPIIRVSDQAGDGSTGSAFLDDQLYIVMFIEYDCQCMRPSAFSIVTDAATDETEW